MLPPASPRRRRTAFVSVLVTATVAAIAAAAPATATAKPTANAAVAAKGTVTVLVGGNGKAARAFKRKRVRVRAIKPASKRGVRLTLRVADIKVGRAAALRLRGGVRFKLRKRGVTARALRLRLTPKRVLVTARVGKRRVPLFVAKVGRGEAKINPIGAAGLDSAKLRLTPRAARLLRKRLRTKRLPAGPLGVVAIDAIAREVADSPGTGPGGGTGGTRPGGGGPAGRVTCDPSAFPPPADPSTEPPVSATPPGAVTVSNLSIVWEPRESWIRYISSGEGICVFNGAIAGPKEIRDGTTTPLTYTFRFPAAVGWYHPGADTGTNADDRAGLRFTGGVGFSWSDHGIDFSTANPEIEIDGGNSRAIFRVNGGGVTAHPNQRQALIDLTWPVADTDPSQHGYKFTIPATIPTAVGSSVFAGFYSAGDPFGSVTVSFTAVTP